MNMIPDYTVYIGLGVLVAIFSSQLKYTKKASTIAIAGVILSALLIVHGFYRFTQREMPCGGMETLEGASLQEMACVVQYLEVRPIPK